MGTILLQGGAEFSGQMAESDNRAIELAGGVDAKILIIPAAAAPDERQDVAGQAGVAWFKSLGATNVEVIPIIDRDSAENLTNRKTLREAKLIYLLSGNANYLATTLRGSSAHEAMQDAYENGAVIAGCGAGAVVMSDPFFDNISQRSQKGLGFIQKICVLPSHDQIGSRWANRVRTVIPMSVLIGLDEETGILFEDEAWHVLGAGCASVYRGSEIRQFASGESFTLVKKQ